MGLAVNANERTLAIGCIERIHHLWLDETYEVEEEGNAKITALCEALSTLAKSETAYHFHYLWLAYCATYDEGHLWYLARMRWRLFTEELKRLYAARNKDLFVVSEGGVV